MINPSRRGAARSRSQAVTLAAAQAERQFWLSLWLVAGLASATLITATVGLFH